MSIMPDLPYLDRRVPDWMVPVCVMFVAFNLADWALTKTVLESGMGREGNPLARLYVGWPVVFLAVKTLWPAFICYRVVRLRQAKSWLVLHGRVLVAWTVVFAFVVTWNTHVLLARGWVVG